MIKFTTGNIFETKADILVNTVNCVGVMGKGIALAFKNTYPEMFEEYKQVCHIGLRPGTLHVWKRKEPKAWVINFPTKDDWRNNSRYEYIEEGLKSLKAYLSDIGKLTIAVPPLGCGYGGLDWAKVKEMIIKHLDGLEAEIVVLEPTK